MSRSPFCGLFENLIFCLSLYRLCIVWCNELNLGGFKLNTFGGLQFHYVQLFLSEYNFLLYEVLVILVETCMVDLS